MIAAPPLGVVVIGHVNHGKTALVRALTGIETDRLPEEQARGLSIALGFAWRDYPSGILDFLDAPGHQDFIRAMVMGAAGARASLLVVSADEGVERQTIEHLRIAGLLGLSPAVVAVTKSDLLSHDVRPELEIRLRAQLAGQVADRAPLIFCSARSGEGLDVLHGALEDLLRRTAIPESLPGAFLPLDRVFSRPGVGTVVTGTLKGVRMATGEEAVLQPSGRRVSIRQLQVHGEPVTEATPGARTAAALRGVTAGDIQVGEVLCTPGVFEPSLRVDIRLFLSPEATRPLRSGEEVRILWGARQDMARVRLLEETSLDPGAGGMAQLRFVGPVPVHAGQRLLLRRPSPAETLAGGEVLDPLAPPLRARILEARRDLLAAVATGNVQGVASALAKRDGGVISLAEVTRLSRWSSDRVESELEGACLRLSPGQFADEKACEAARRAFLEQLAAIHRDQPTRAFAPLAAFRSGLMRQFAADLVAHLEARLLAAGDIRIERGGVALSSHDPFAAMSPDQSARLGRIEAAYLDAGLNPPSPSAFDPGLMELLVSSGRLVSLRNHALRQTLVFHIQALDAARSSLEAIFPPPMTFTTGEAREALSTSRKFIVPTLEFLDARGETIRRGDTRQVVRSEDLPGPVPGRPGAPQG